MVDEVPNFCDFRLSDLLKPGSLGEDVFSMALQSLLTEASGKLDTGTRGKNICGLVAVLTGKMAGIEFCEYPFNNQTNCPKVLAMK